MKAEECISGKRFAIRISQTIHRKHRGRCLESRTALNDFNARNFCTISEQQKNRAESFLLVLPNWIRSVLAPFLYSVCFGFRLIERLKACRVMKEQLHNLSSLITRAVRLHPGLCRTDQADNPYLQEQHPETFYILRWNISRALWV